MTKPLADGLFGGIPGKKREYHLWMDHLSELGLDKLKVSDEKVGDEYFKNIHEYEQSYKDKWYDAEDKGYIEYGIHSVDSKKKKFVLLSLNVECGDGQKKKKHSEWLV